MGSVRSQAEATRLAGPVRAPRPHQPGGKRRKDTFNQDTEQQRAV